MFLFFAKLSRKAVVQAILEAMSQLLEVVDEHPVSQGLLIFFSVRLLVLQVVTFKSFDTTVICRLSTEETKQARVKLLDQMLNLFVFGVFRILSENM